MEYSKWEPKKSSWSAQERRAQSTVRTSFVHLLLFIISFILDHESSGRETHDSHKLQTKAINHVTRHYMNRRELESNQPIDAPSLCVLSFPPSALQCSTVAIAGRRAPHLATTRKDTAAATVLS